MVAFSCYLMIVIRDDFVYSGCYCRWITLLEKCPSKKNHCFPSLITGLLPFFIKKWSACIFSVFRDGSWSIWSSYPTVSQWRYYFSEKRKNVNGHITTVTCLVHGGISWYFLQLTSFIWKVNGYIACEKRHDSISPVHHPELYAIYISRYNSQQWIPHKLIKLTKF